MLACLLQRNVRVLLRRRRGKRFRAALLVIHGLMRAYVRKFRAKRRNKAANLIMQFLVDHSNHSAMLRHVKMFLKRVRKSQRLVKSYFNITRARMQALKVLWKLLELDRAYELYQTQRQLMQNRQRNVKFLPM